ncbi:MAG: hypothetical protein M3680_04435 [Myxococcota bacterium]|nr:hypothetical protein [Myxococcota bacterium]
MRDQPAVPTDEVVGNGMKAIADAWTDRVQRDDGVVMSDAERARGYRMAALAIVGCIALGLLIVLALYLLDG